MVRRIVIRLPFSEEVTPEDKPMTIWTRFYPGEKNSSNI